MALSNENYNRVTLSMMRWQTKSGRRTMTMDLKIINEKLNLPHLSLLVNDFSIWFWLVGVLVKEHYLAVLLIISVVAVTWCIMLSDFLLSSSTLRVRWLIAQAVKRIRLQCIYALCFTQTSAPLTWFLQELWCLLLAFLNCDNGPKYRENQDLWEMYKVFWKT